MLCSGHLQYDLPRCLPGRGRARHKPGHCSGEGRPAEECSGAQRLGNRGGIADAVPKEQGELGRDGLCIAQQLWAVCVGLARSVTVTGLLPSMHSAGSSAIFLELQPWMSREHRSAVQAVRQAAS